MAHNVARAIRRVRNNSSSRVRYAVLLGAIVDTEVVSAVDRKLQAFDPLGGKIFGVQVAAHDGMYSVDVNLLFDDG